MLTLALTGDVMLGRLVNDRLKFLWGAFTHHCQLVRKRTLRYSCFYCELEQPC